MDGRGKQPRLMSPTQLSPSEEMGDSDAPMRGAVMDDDAYVDEPCPVCKEPLGYDDVWVNGRHVHRAWCSTGEA